ncbi:TolC family protein, partial [bacterium]|nr:TolC family protein [candidate division CSSED10-310 bacterium]
GLTIHFDLFFIGREGRVYQEAAKYRQQKLQYLDMREQVIFEVRSAISALEDADEFVKAQARTVDQANEGLRLAEVGYKEGTLDQVSVLEARTALNQAQLLYWNSLYNHTIARISLEKALGELDPKLQENTTDENQLSNLE